MSVFASPSYDRHERVVFGHDAETGLRAIIAVHNTALGPAVGGCRMWPYENDAAALEDALRLARGMTYKSALAGLPFGGGKSVIIGDSRTEKTPALMRAMGRLVDELGGRYLVAEDVGTTVADMDAIATQTKHVTGTSSSGGNPSPYTARGVFQGIRAAVEYKLRRNAELEGIDVAIQGLGSVGYELARRLHAAGARLHVADINTETLNRAADEFGATTVDTHDIHAIDVDIFAPCALGGAINDRTIGDIHARIVAGSANNQLAERRHGAELAARGILYAPDYVTNAGGIIELAYSPDFGREHDEEAIRTHIDGLYDTLMEIFARADKANAATNEIANQMAEERFMAA